jgi:hypothetical protein
MKTKKAETTKDMIDRVSVNRAKKKYKEIYGKDISPSLIKSELEGGMLSPKTKNYGKIRKAEIKKSKGAKKKVDILWKKVGL